MKKEALDKTNFLKIKEIKKPLFILNIILAGIYFVVLTFFFPRGNSFLFGLLVAGEVFHIWQIGTYMHTVWATGTKHKFSKKFKPPVDVFITVAGEDLDIIETTITKAQNMDYPAFKVYVLNDGYVAKKKNWKEVEVLAEKLGVTCITRQQPGGAKAGNINNALKHTHSPLVTIFDADHAPQKNFLKKTVGYFADPLMAFVQTPQFYKNNNLNQVTGGAWEQQELFFGAICKGKNRTNSVFMCGTNMVLRRTALNEVGGMNEKNITEDLLTSQFIHEKGWKSVYIGEVLAEGLAPEDLRSYMKQQYRWARGSLELIFRYNAFFRRGLTFSQRIQYLASSSYYLSGSVVLINALLPLIFLFTGQSPFEISTSAMAAAFLPYILITVYTLMLSSNYSYTYRAVSFSMSTFLVHIHALLNLLTGRKATFQVTSKKALSGNFLYLAFPHLAYIALGTTGILIGLEREGLSAALVTNASWLLFNASMFLPFILAAIPQKAPEKAAKKVISYMD